MEEKQEEQEGVRKGGGGGPCVLFLHAFGRHREGFRIPPSDNNFLPSFQVFV